MADIEKVIKGLEVCTKHEMGVRANDCLDCPYIENIGFNQFRCKSEEMKMDALELLKEQPHWIPVEERLPKSMANKVIVYLQHEDYVPEIGYGHYEKYKGEEMWYNLETDEQFIKRGYKVTHWMPMPKSPEGEKLILT